MASISDEKLQELRDRVDVAAVVQRRVPLKKSGRDLKGLCPFHGEKTPSFYVIPDKRMFHCFGCGKTGDAIRFVMETEGKSFREAVEELAAEVGVTLEADDPEERKRTALRAALAEVNEKAATFFTRVLWELPLGKLARDHLEARGITQETSKAWRLGYAPDRWDALTKSLAKSNVDPKLIEQAGLGVPRTKGKGLGTLYDRFRGRLIIPIRESGRTVAFGGRLMEGESDAKYLNSPETPLYQKGHTLFGLDRARDAIRKEGLALFVEGYFDAIGLHQAGVQTAVATCGTAMTERHLELVMRAGAKELVFVFDGDAAGIRAALRASELAAAAGIAARVLVPPNGEDPDETVLRVGTAAFRELVTSAQHSLEFLLDWEIKASGAESSAEAQVRAVHAVASLVRKASFSARGLYVSRIAKKLGVDDFAIRAALEGAKANAGSGAGANARAGANAMANAMANAGATAGANAEANAREAAKARAEAHAGQSAQGGQGHPGRVASQAPARSGAIEPNRLEAKVELQIVSQMLTHPDLCRLVDESGVAADFRVAALREFAESAFVSAREGLLDARAQIDAAEPEALRKALERELDEMEKGHAETPELERASLQKKLERLKRQDFGVRHHTT